MVFPEHPICRASVHTNCWNARCSSRRTRRARRGWHFDTPNIHWAVNVTWVGITQGKGSLTRPQSSAAAQPPPRGLLIIPKPRQEGGSGELRIQGQEILKALGITMDVKVAVLRSCGVLWHQLFGGSKRELAGMPLNWISTKYFQIYLEQTDILVAQTTDHRCEVIKSSAPEALKKQRPKWKAFETSEKLLQSELAWAGLAARASRL